jgi:hypothetical protein
VKLRARAEVHVPKPPEAVFDFATACETFPRILLPLGPVPGIAKAEMLGAGAPRAGARRRIGMTDGSTIDEEILAFDRPGLHRYRWLNRPAPPFSWLVRGGEAEWTFAPSQGGTRIVWTYAFELTTPLVAPLGAAVIAVFRRWMMRGLEGVRSALAG